MHQWGTGRCDCITAIPKNISGNLLLPRNEGSVLRKKTLETFS